MRRLALAALLTLGSVFVAAWGGGSEPGSPQAGTSAQAVAPAATQTGAQATRREQARFVPAAPAS